MLRERNSRTRASSSWDGGSVCLACRHSISSAFSRSSLSACSSASRRNADISRAPTTGPEPSNRPSCPQRRAVLITAVMPQRFPSPSACRTCIAASSAAIPPGLALATVGSA